MLARLWRATARPRAASCDEARAATPEPHKRARARSTGRWCARLPKVLLRTANIYKTSPATVSPASHQLDQPRRSPAGTGAFEGPRPAPRLPGTPRRVPPLPLPLPLDQIRKQRGAAHAKPGTPEAECSFRTAPSPARATADPERWDISPLGSPLEASADPAPPPPLGLPAPAGCTPSLSVRSDASSRLEFDFEPFTSDPWQQLARVEADPGRRLTPGSPRPESLPPCDLAPPPADSLPPAPECEAQVPRSPPRSPMRSPPRSPRVPPSPALSFCSVSTAGVNPLAEVQACIQELWSNGTDLETRLLGQAPPVQPLCPHGALVPSDLRAFAMKKRPPALCVSDADDDQSSDGGRDDGQLTSPARAHGSGRWSFCATPPLSETASSLHRTANPVQLLEMQLRSEARFEANRWSDAPPSARSQRSTRSLRSNWSSDGNATSGAETVASRSDLRDKGMLSSLRKKFRRGKRPPRGQLSDEDGSQSGSCSETDGFCSDNNPLRFYPRVGVCPEEEEGEEDAKTSGERIVSAFMKLHPEYVTETRTQVAMKEFKLTVHDMADHIEAFELLAKGKGYITWKDVKGTMQSTLQHSVSDAEAKALVQGVTGSPGKPMNLFDFIRFARTSLPREGSLESSLQPVVLHL